MERYKVKNRVEHWIFFKLLKLPVIFYGTYFGLFITALILGLPRRRRSGEPVVFAPFIEELSDLLLIVSGLVVIYYLFTKLRHNEIDEIAFDDKMKILKITYRNYLFHFKYAKGYYYSDLDFTHELKRDFINGEYEHVEFFLKTSVLP